jgi:uncharacterized protein DUF4784
VRAKRALVIAGAAAALAWALAGQTVERHVPLVATSARLPRPAADAAPAAGPVARPPEPATAAATDTAPAVVSPAALAHTTADDYRRRARYPRSSAPLADYEDPIARDRDVTPIRMHGPRGEEPTLTVYPASSGFEAPEPVVLHADLSIHHRRIRAGEIRATVLTDALQPVATLWYRDDGTAGDAVAGDHVYTAVFTPAPQPVETLAASYLVQVEARSVRGTERFATTSFLYSMPHAYLTGNFRDAIVDGSLAVEAEVDVRLAGRFHLEATLYSGDAHRALAWAQTAGELDPGRHWMSLGYYGLILRERGVDGPYLLRRVALSTATGMPNAKNRVLENAWRTGTYAASAFTDRPFDDPNLLDTAGRLERDGGGPARLEAGG